MCNSLLCYLLENGFKTWLIFHHIYCRINMPSGTSYVRRYSSWGAPFNRDFLVMMRVLVCFLTRPPPPPIKNPFTLTHWIFLSMHLIAIKISRGISEVLDLQSKNGSHLRKTFCQRDLSIHSEISILILWAILTGVTGMVDVKQTEVLNFFRQLYASCIQQYCQSLNLKKNKKQ